jgi:hypothetical protein
MDCSIHIESFEHRVHMGGLDMAIDVCRYGVMSGLGMPKSVGKAHVRVDEGQVLVTFTEPRGYGDSKFMLRVEPTSFGELIQVMLRAHPEEAIKAFATALKDGIPAPVRHGQWWPGRDDSPPKAA